MVLLAWLCVLVIGIILMRMLSVCLYSKTPPPPDSVYADPNCIEHEATPVGTEYAMVDRKVKEKKHNKNQPPPQPEPPSLYQVLYCVCLFVVSLDGQFVTVLCFRSLTYHK